MLAQPDFTDVLEARNFVVPIGYHSQQYINEVTLNKLQKKETNLKKNYYHHIAERKEVHIYLFNARMVRKNK